MIKTAKVQAVTYGRIIKCILFSAAAGFSSNVVVSTISEKYFWKSEVMLHDIFSTLLLSTIVIGMFITAFGCIVIPPIVILLNRINMDKILSFVVLYNALGNFPSLYKILWTKKSFSLKIGSCDVFISGEYSSCGMDLLLRGVFLDLIIFTIAGIAFGICYKSVKFNREGLL